MSRHNNTTMPSSSLIQWLIFTLPLISTILLLNLPSAHANWIDEDTPQEDRTVSPLKMVPNLPPPKHPKKDDDDDDNRRRNHKRRREPTIAPSYFPTYDPTGVPSSAPSSVTPPPTQPERIYDLVFSDEFNTPHRTFEDGADPRWTALEKNDYTNDAQHFYSTKNAYTDTKGNLVIKSEAADTKIVGFNDITGKKEQVSKHFKSAMLQSWVPLCASTPPKHGKRAG